MTPCACYLEWRPLPQIDADLIDRLRVPPYAASPRGLGCNSSVAIQTAAAIFAQHSSPASGGDSGGVLANMWRAIPEPLQHLLGSGTASVSLNMRRRRRGRLLAEYWLRAVDHPAFGLSQQERHLAAGASLPGHQHSVLADHRRLQREHAAAVGAPSPRLLPGTGGSGGSSSWLDSPPSAAGLSPISGSGRARALAGKLEAVDGQLKDQSLIIRNAWEGESKLLRDPYAADELPATAAALVAQYRALGHACPLFARKFAPPTSIRLAEVARQHTLD